MAEKEYIEREALKNNIHCTKEGLFFCGGKTYIEFGVVSKAVLETPAADVVEVVRGEWTGCDGDNCSVCGRSPSEIMDADSYYAIGFNINDLVACPFCGAKMDEKDGEETEAIYNDV